MRKYLIVLISVLVIVGSFILAVTLYRLEIINTIPEPIANPSIHRLLLEESILNDLHDSYNDSTQIVINILEAWCAPCLEEIPRLNHLAAKYHNKNILFVALTSCNKEDLLMRFENMGLTFDYHIYFNQGELINDINTAYFGQTSTVLVPQHILLTKYGEVGLFLTGASEKNIFLLDNYLNRGK